MTDTAMTLTLERALTVGGIGLAPSGELSPVTRAIYARQAGLAHDWKRRELHSASNTFTPEQLAQYALYLVENGYARSTAGLAVRAIRWRHRVAGEPVPDGLPASYVLRAQDSTVDDQSGVNAAERPASRDPSELLSAFVSGCKPGEPKGVRDLAIVNLLYWSGMTVERLSELDLHDVAPDPGPRPLTVEKRVIRLPINAAYTAELRHIPEPQHYATLCPVCTVDQWFDLLMPLADGLGEPLFRAVDKGGNVAGAERHGGRHGAGGRLHAKNINQVVLRNLAARAGLVDVLVSPARALRLAGACAAYVRGEVDAAGAAARAGYSPRSPLFTEHLLTLTAPHREDTSR